MTSEDFDLNKASTYKEALMIVSNDLKSQIKEISRLGTAVNKIGEDQAEFREMFAEQNQKNTKEHSEIEHYSKLNKKDIEVNKEAIGSFKKWNFADTINVAVTALLVGIKEIFN